MNRIVNFILLIICGVSGVYASIRDTIDLSGSWNYWLRNAPLSIPGEGDLILPSTLDNQHKSVYNPESDNTSQLRREFSYSGEAAFSKSVDIPFDWGDKEIELVMERTKPSYLKIDRKLVDNNSRISSSQKYILSDVLSPGAHTLEIYVNNADSIPPIVARSSSAVSEATQTNWNGILGNILLVAKNKFNIRNIKIDDSRIPQDNISLFVSFSKPADKDYTLTGKINGSLFNSSSIEKGSKDIEIEIPVSQIELWSDRNPVLYDLTLEILDDSFHPIDSYSLKTGFRKFATIDDYFTINNRPVFLRGNVNAAIFPLTAHAPMDIDSWKNYFSTLKNYGFNHVRFHSWTPPEAAFQAADELGFYILTELPIWGELDRDLNFHNRFLKEELIGIMEDFSHHPSFVMFSTGNELWGDISLMGEYKNEAKNLNPRILSTYGSNVYLGMNGQIGDEDFILSAKTADDPNKSVRGSQSFADSPSGGFFNSQYPNSSFNYENATRDISVPIISHEVGQYQSYPDFEEIEKYTGILKPDNLKIFRQRAEEAGTLRKSSRFKDASGKWAAKLYKAEMELALRSPGIAGFELFGIQDYPGQGTALIGMLNPFMESKGYVSPEYWKNVSSDATILAEFPRFSFYEDEYVKIPVLSVNFTENPNLIKTINWSTDFDSGIINANEGFGVIDNDYIVFKTPKVTQPKKMTLKLNSNNARNEYDFWVYPKNAPEVKNVTLTDNLTEALILLDQGENVILSPDSKTVAEASLDPLFTTDFWNYRMYRSICDEMSLTPPPGTLGLYLDPDHPALKKFPTDSHTDWQWFPIIINSRPLIYDRLPKDFDPIIEVIDNVERNFRLSLMLECKVGKGKLIILSSDINKLSQFPEGKWFLQSVKEYLGSKECKPEFTLTSDQVVNLVTKPSQARLIKELKNETYRRFE